MAEDSDPTAALLRAVAALDQDGGMSDVELEECRAALKAGRPILVDPLAFPGRKPEDRAAVQSRSVELTPGGRKKHTLQRTSPGGTTRASQYTSPSRAEVIAELCLHEECAPEDLYDPDWDLDMEQWRRRNVAMEFVPGQQTELQQELVRSAKRAHAIEYPCA